MRKTRSIEQMIRTIVSRRTRGAAFSDADYTALRARVEQEVSEAFEKDAEAAKHLYRNYLWDEKGV